MIYHTPDEYANHYTTDAVSSVYDVLLVFVYFWLNSNNIKNPNNHLSLQINEHK
jgi:hypothetical protein